MRRILVIDDEQSLRDMLGILLRREGYQVDVAGSGREARKLLSRAYYAAIIADIQLPDESGIEILRHVRDVSPQSQVIIITAFASTESAIEALKLGATDYITKPFDNDELKIVVRNAVEKGQLEDENVALKNELEQRYGFGELVGDSPQMRAVFEMMERVVETNSTVLVRGESGTGKELIARAIHYHENSPRRERPFVSINCGALPDELLESELFGHIRGSFTGATSTKKGLFEVAHGGTIFLDEIGETSSAMQIKLLRVLQDRKIRMVGGTDETEVDLRVITATNQDLDAMVRSGTFREDLYYRINVIPIHLPPLRDKRDDIPALAQHFLAKCSRQMGKRVLQISDEVMELLCRYDWPGNARELGNVIERAVVLEASDTIRVESLPAELRQGSSGRPRGEVELPDTGIDLEAMLEQTRERFMIAALARTQGVQIRAAELLGMTFRSFRYFANKYRLKGRDFRARQ